MIMTLPDDLGTFFINESLETGKRRDTSQCHHRVPRSRDLSPKDDPEVSLLGVFPPPDGTGGDDMKTALCSQRKIRESH